MPPPPPRVKHYFYHGHRKPSQNRPVVYGGLFTNRKTLRQTTPSSSAAAVVDFNDWDPSSNPSSSASTPSLSSSDRRLSPLARFITSSLRRHRRWSPAILSDLSSLRRVPPHLVAEVLRSQPPLPAPLSTAFFHWASRQKNFRPSFASYNALIHSLNPNAADRIPDLMRSQGKPPSEKQLEILVGIHSRAGRGLRLHHLYRRMRSDFSVKPRVFLYNRIIDSLVRTNHLDLALSVYNDMRADGSKEEPITFTILAKGLARAGRIDELLQILERMRRELCRPDVFAYTAMVKVLASEGNLAGCLRVWEEMRRDGVDPDPLAYSTLVSGLCKVGRAERARELFREMKEKKLLVDRAVYASLVDGFVDEGNVGAGCELLKEMVEDGYRADSAIYDSLIRGLCEAQNAGKAYKLFRIVVQEGLIPGFETVSPLLALYSDTDRMESLFELVDQVRKLGLPVMDHLSHFFVFFLAKGEGRELKAFQVFEALKGKGLCNTAIYNTLIESLHGANMEKRALSLFEDMKGSKEAEPDSSTYTLIIPCFVDNGDVEGACSCYNKMKEMSWTPGISAYCSLVRGLCKIGEINAALTLVKDCLGNVVNGPMEFKYALTVLNSCRSGKAEKVVAVLDEMVEQGYPLESIVYCAVIHGFCKYSTSREAKKVFALLKDRNILRESEVIVYEDLLNEHLKKTAADLVISGLKFFNLESKLKLTSSTDGAY